MSELTFYNTRSKKMEPFTPLDPGKVSLYSCGPTVYDHAHIGNLSAYVFADTLRRTLQVSGLEVNHVMNFTDVDDKTIARSRDLEPGNDPIEALKTLTRKFEAIFLSDVEKIGFDIPAVIFVRATEHIPQMQDIIRKLHASGFAYITDDGVYFSIDAYRKAGHIYGQLTQITEQSTSQARISNDEYDKDSIHDFALWKLQKGQEPAWEFELDGRSLLGRPGWHIECSAMSQATLGQPFDIHTGGVDNIFPHHENEIAQSTAVGDKLYANFFMHNEHVLVEGRKMAKSAQNFYTLSDIIEKGFDPLAFRLLILQSHYRSQTNFTWESLEAAQNRLNQLRAWADLRHQSSIETMPEELDALWGTTLSAIKTHMFRDLDTPGAFAALAQLVSYMNQNPIPNKDGKNTGSALALLDKLFGLQLDNRPDITDDQKQLLHERSKAREAQDWAKSDELRATLEAEGLSIRDTDTRQIWSRV